MIQPVASALSTIEGSVAVAFIPRNWTKLVDRTRLTHRGIFGNQKLRRCLFRQDARVHRRGFLLRPRACRQELCDADALMTQKRR
jgi:hypothetical protein